MPTPDYSALKAAVHKALADPAQIDGHQLFAAGFDDLYRFTCKRCLVSNSVTFSAGDDLAVVRTAIVEAMGGRCVPVGNVPMEEL